VSILTVQQITAHALQVLEKQLLRASKPEYRMRSRYGKYSIYKRENGISTTLAKGLSKDAATGMMKLLEDYDD
jgi:hypothetical protein